MRQRTLRSRVTRLASALAVAAGFALALQIGGLPVGAQSAQPPGESRQVPGQGAIDPPAGPPPDIAETLEQEKTGPPKRGKRATTEELLQRVAERQENGQEMVRKIRAGEPGKAVDPPAGPPPDIQEFLDQMKQDFPGQKPPGAGRPLSLLERVVPFVSLVNPLVARTAHAAGGSFSVSLTPSPSGTGCATGAHGCLYSPSPYAFAATYAGQITYAQPTNDWIYLRELSVSWPGGWSSKTQEPYMWLQVTIPTTGWYLFNIEAYTTASMRFTTPSSLYRTFTPISGDNNNPHTLYMNAGTHYLYWVFSSWAYVYEIRVEDI